MQKAKLEMTAGLALAAAAVLFIAWGVWKAVAGNDGRENGVGCG